MVWLIALLICGAAYAEELYNGIRLPAEWPPRIAFNYEPMDPPYLKNPPAVIPIDVGRQLFVDDFLVERTDLQRAFHTATYHPATPVLRPDKPWEQEGASPTAMPFSGGIVYDPKDQRYKLWYMCGYVGALCYADSADGVRWHKPLFETRPGSNIVIPVPHDTSTVWLDHEESDPRKRFKAWLSRPMGSLLLPMYTSPDGIRWKDADARPAVNIGDRSTVFYNPFRRVWVYSIRSGAPKFGRYRHYREHPNAAEGTRFGKDDLVPWVGADRLDAKRSDLNTDCQLYNLDGVAYESLMVGLFSIWRGQPKDRAKPNEVLLGYSRDGFHWSRPDRRPFLPVSERYGDWNWGNVQSTAGGFLVAGDRLYFYVSGRGGVPGTTDSGASSTGLAVIRRDGFASMDGAGTLTTRTVKFSGKHLFVNVSGEVCAEVLDAGGQTIAPFTVANCTAVKEDTTHKEIRWTSDLGAVAGKPVKFRFHLRRGSLYAFWVSPEATGASHGYVAGGGPGFTGPTDTTGR